MTNERIDEKAIFNVARQIDSSDARREYLRQVCGADEALLARLETLLEAYAEQLSFLETPPAPSFSRTVDLPVIERAGTVIGPYKLLQQIGEGGMGVVYMAEQTKPIARMVALKIIRPGMDTQQVVARFEAERQALAMMDHPNIAKVLDAGTTESERPYFVMELVKGVPITNYCDDHHLTPQKRLELFLQVLHAVQHAHQKGIVHRDIKPSNVLVAEYDQQAVPKVIDFGVAKATSQKLTDKTMFTQFGQLIGTLEYMSPEQAKLNQMDIDTRCDIYSLGVLLYELLTGDTPFDRKRLRLAAFEEMMRIIREEDPPVPSTRLSTSGMLASVSANRSTEPRKLSNFMRGELDWIVMRAMEKERSRRYETANAFADDIQRFLNQEAVVARPVSTAYRMKKFAQRNWGAVIASSVIATTLLIGFGTSTWFAVRESRAAAEANRQRLMALSAKENADRQRAAAEIAGLEETKQREIAQRNAMEAITAREAEAVERAAAVKERDRVSTLNLEIEKQAEQQRRMRYTSDMNLIQSAWDAENVDRVQELLNTHRPQPGQSDLRGFEWHYWNRQCHSDFLTVKRPEIAGIGGAVFSPDGSLLAGVFSDREGRKRTIKALNTLPNAEPCKFAVDLDNFSGIQALAWHPDGDRLAVSTVDTSSLILRVYYVKTSKSLFTIVEPRRIEKPAGFVFARSELWFSADGSRIGTAVIGQPHTNVKFWDAGSGEEIASIPLPGEFVSNVCISPDGFHIAYSVSTDGTEASLSVKILEVSSPEKPVTVPVGRLVKYLFTPDSRQLFVSGIADGSSQLAQEIGGGVFDVTSGAKIFSLPIFSGWSLARFSPDGKWFAVCKSNRPRSVSLISTSGDRSPVELLGHSDLLVSLRFSPDSQYLYTAGFGSRPQDHSIKTWDVATAVRPELTRPPSGISTLSSGSITAVSKDSKLNASAPRPSIKWPIITETPPSNTRKNVVTMRDESWNVLHQSPELIGPVQWLTFSADGRRLAACASASESDFKGAAQLIVLDAASGVEQFHLRLPTNEGQLDIEKGPDVSLSVPTVLLSPDGRQLAALINRSSGNLKTSSIRVWEIDSKRQIWQSEAISESLQQIWSSPDGDRIAAISDSRRKLSVWDAKDGRMLWSEMDKVGIHGLDFSADGKLIFGLTTSNGVIKLWDSDSGRELTQIPIPEWQGGSTQVIALALSHNGRRLAASAGQVSGVRVWNIDRPESELFTLPLQKTGMITIAFSPDDRRIAIGTHSNNITNSTLESEGQTKVWDAETGNELLTLTGAVGYIEFNDNGTVLTGDMGNLWEFYINRWDARPLAPQIEAEQMIDAFTKPQSGQSVPLLSEILGRIDADKTLLEDTRATAVSLAKNLRREKTLNEAAYSIVALRDQPQQKYERALQYLEEACAIDPNNRQSWSIRGLAHFRLGQATEALAALSHSQELHAKQKLPQPSDDLITLAMMQLHAGQLEESRLTLDQARTSVSRCEANWESASKFARNVKAWQGLLSEAEMLIGVPKAANNPTRWIGRAVMPRLYATVDNANGEATSPYLPYIIDRVDADRLWFGKNSIARSQVVPLEDAERYYTRLLEGNPQSAHTYNYLGITRRATGDYDKAIDYYSSAIRLDPTEAVYYQNRGNLWHKDKRDFDKALADYDEALQLRPMEAKLHTLRGILRREQGHPDDALKSFDEAIRLQPDQGRAYAHRAGIWSVQGDKIKMQQDLDDAIRHSPDSPGTLGARAWLMATSPNAEHRNGKQAVKEAQKACEQFTGDADIYRLYDTLAAALAETSDFEQAIKYQEMALVLAPPAWRTEFESRKMLYLDGQPYRDPLLCMPVVTGQ